MSSVALFDLSKLVSPKTNNENETVVSSPLPPKRCQQPDCKMKLKLTDQKCKCKKYFCSKHRHFTDHTCEFDYKTIEGKKLEKDLVKVEANKLDKI